MSHLPPKRTEWISGGEPIAVETAHIEGETDGRWQGRHDEAVEFWKGVFPED